MLACGYDLFLTKHSYTLLKRELDLIFLFFQWDHNKTERDHLLIIELNIYRHICHIVSSLKSFLENKI